MYSFVYILPKTSKECKVGVKARTDLNSIPHAGVSPDFVASLFAVFNATSRSHGLHIMAGLFPNRIPLPQTCADSQCYPTTIRRAAMMFHICASGCFK